MVVQYGRREGPTSSDGMDFPSRGQEDHEGSEEDSPDDRGHPWDYWEASTVAC